MAQGNETAIEVSNLDKSFGKRKAIDNISLRIRRGEMVALIGPSGSGKSTLLRHVAGLLPSDRNSGSIKIDDRIVQRKGSISGNIRKIRSDVGFIFQQFNLVGRLTLLENVLVGKLSDMPVWRTLPRFFTRREKVSAMRALQRVGLAEHAGQRASTLSGGQQQRAAIARAMEQEARIILADEPIASLDPESARLVMSSLAALNRNNGVTVLISLHQVQFALQYCPRSIALKDGKIIFDGPSRQLSAATLGDVYGSSFSRNMIDGTAPIVGQSHTPRVQEETLFEQFAYEGSRA